MTLIMDFSTLDADLDKGIGDSIADQLFLANGIGKPFCLNEITPTLEYWNNGRDILDVLKQLGNGMPRSEAANLEYSYGLIYCYYDETPENLLKEIAENPSVFCRIMFDLFGNDRCPYLAMQFLPIIRLLPEIYSSEVKFKNWIDQVMDDEIRKNNREIIDYQVGNLISRIIRNDDEAWSMKGFVDVIQEHSENERFIMGIVEGYDRNSPSRRITGEVLESDLKQADDFERRAVGYHASHPKVSEILRCFAYDLKQEVGYFKKKMMNF